MMRCYSLLSVFVLIIHIIHANAIQISDDGPVKRADEGGLLARTRVRRAAVQSSSVGVYLDAQFGVPQRGNVSQGKEIVYKYTYEEVSNKTTAVRIHVSSEHASLEYPVLFVVRQQRAILSWQVPLVLENVFNYYSVSRTLCPVESAHKHEPKQAQTLYVDVSSLAKVNTSFTMTALKIDDADFTLRTDTPHMVTVSPSQPKFYQYHFPDGVDSVVVKVTSADDLCMTVSIQDVHCPVFDLVRNVEFTGQFQTMTTQAAITVQRSVYKTGAFYVVFVVKPSDLDCSGLEKIQPAVPGGDELMRTKNLTVVLEKTASAKQYLVATLGAAAWFLIFYVGAFLISIVYHVWDNISVSRSQSPPEQMDNKAASPCTPIMSGDGETSYGATSGEFGRKTNGIPHRIAPVQAEDSDSSVDDSEIDMLPEVDEDKNIFRTKPFLYVSDLARKERRVLEKKYKVYFWNLLTIAVFYGLPVVQLVITYQEVMHVTGNEDICFYNFLCARPLGVLSSFNTVYSNIGYVMLGALFLILVARRDVLHKRAIKQDSRFDKSLGIPQHFGLFYAMGIALMMEGILSGCYHVCPSYSNFQFDTSFMYMLAWLCMLKIYQIRHPDINAHAHTAYLALACVIFVAVIGVFSGQSSLGLGPVSGTWVFWVLFALVHIFATLFLSAQIYYMGRWKLDIGIFRRVYLLIRNDLLHCTKPMYTDRMILLVTGNLVNWSFAIFGLVTQPKDFASYLLAIFMVNLLMYFAFYIIMKLRSGEKILPLALVYIVLAMIVWGFALYFFMMKRSTWELTPAESRALNVECSLLGFYDDHDIWHFLSAMSMFFSFMILLVLDDDLIYVPRDQIKVF